MQRVLPMSAKTILRRPLPRMDWATRTSSSVTICCGWVTTVSISSRVISRRFCHCCCRSSACFVQMICIAVSQVLQGLGRWRIIPTRPKCYFQFLPAIFCIRQLRECPTLSLEPTPADNTAVPPQPRLRLDAVLSNS